MLGRARKIIAGEEVGGKGWEGWDWVRERVVDEGDPEPVESMLVDLTHVAEPLPLSLPVEERMVVDPVQEDAPVEDDGWGFDEEAQTAPAPPPPPPAVSEPTEEDDGWGFDASPPTSPLNPPSVAAKSSHGRKQSVDGWGFDSGSDEESSKPLTPSSIAPRQARRLEKAQARSKGLSGSSTLSPVRSASTSSSLVEDLVEEERSASAVRGGMKLGKKSSGSNLSLGSSRRQGSDTSALPSPMYEAESEEERIEQDLAPTRRGPTTVTERMVVSARSKVVVEIAESVIRDVEAMKLLP